jgi:endonuclease III-like uncharacterized protein
VITYRNRNWKEVETRLRKQRRRKYLVLEKICQVKIKGIRGRAGGCITFEM